MKLLKKMSTETMQKIEDILMRLSKIGNIHNYTEEEVLNYIEEEFDLENPLINYDSVIFEINDTILKYSLIRDNKIRPYEYKSISEKFDRIPESVILEEYNDGYFEQLYAYGDNYVVYKKPDGKMLQCIDKKNTKLMFMIAKNIQEMYAKCLKRNILPVDLTDSDIYCDEKGNIKVLSTQSFVSLKEIKEKYNDFIRDENSLESVLFCWENFVEYSL